MTTKLTAVTRAEGELFVSLCPELDIASQGDTIEHAQANLREALDLFFEYATDEEVIRRLTGPVYVTQMEIEVGQAAGTLR